MGGKVVNEFLVRFLFIFLALMMMMMMMIQLPGVEDHDLVEKDLNASVTKELDAKKLSKIRVHAAIDEDQLEKSRSRVC